jgi:hypothetical protein
MLLDFLIARSLPMTKLTKEEIKSLKADAKSEDLEEE